MARYANSELIAVGWVNSLGLPTQAGLSLPADLSSWTEHGFVTVSGGVGGSPAADVGWRRPIVQLDFWGCRPESEQAPWNKTGSLAETVVNATYGSNRTGVPTVLVPLPAGFEPVLLRTVTCVNEPRPVYGDPSGFARWTADFKMLWTLA